MVVVAATVDVESKIAAHCDVVQPVAPEHALIAACFCAADVDWGDGKSTQILTPLKHSNTFKKH